MALSISPRGIAFGPVLRWKDPCLYGASERFIEKPGSALSCSVLTKEDVVMMSAIRTLHLWISKLLRLLHLS